MDWETFLSVCEVGVLQKIGTFALARAYADVTDPKLLFREYLLCAETKLALRMSGKCDEMTLQWLRAAVRHVAELSDTLVARGRIVVFFMRPVEPAAFSHEGRNAASVLCGSFGYVPHGSYVFGNILKGCFSGESCSERMGVKPYFKRTNQPTVDFVEYAIDAIMETSERPWRVYTIHDDDPEWAMVERGMRHLPTLIAITCHRYCAFPAT